MTLAVLNLLIISGLNFLNLSSAVGLAKLDTPSLSEIFALYENFSSDLRIWPAMNYGQVKHEPSP